MKIFSIQNKACEIILAKPIYFVLQIFPSFLSLFPISFPPLFPFLKIKQIENVLNKNKIERVAAQPYLSLPDRSRPILLLSGPTTPSLVSLPSGSRGESTHGAVAMPRHPTCSLPPIKIQHRLLPLQP